MKNDAPLILMVTLCLFLVASSSLGREPPGPSRTSESLHALQGRAGTTININNFTVWISGSGAHPPLVDNSWNGTFPKGAGGAIFSEGILWCGFVRDTFNPELRAGGSMYYSANWPGAILTDSTGKVVGAEDPFDPAVGAYRVRPDFQWADLSDDAAHFFLVPLESVSSDDIQHIYDQYKADWLEWPWQKGAPYDDRDGNGIYEPDPNGNGIYGELQVDRHGDTTYAEDIPGIPGADQTVWIVHNDLSIEKFASSAPRAIGLEVQETYWAYAVESGLGNTVFKRVWLIYKGTEETPQDAAIDSMYIAQWSDPDLGNYTDDLVGCDISSSLGYVYNGSNSDAVWDAWGIAPPAAGYALLQGPIVATGNPADVGMFNFGQRYGYQNLTMAAFVPGGVDFNRIFPSFHDSKASIKWYNIMRGCEPAPGYPSCNPLLDHEGRSTNFPFSGDPLRHIGDLDGQPTASNSRRPPPGDRQLVLSTGPFNMSLGDTQEVVIALLGGSGRDYLLSIELLKAYSREVEQLYDHNFRVTAGPPAPVVRVTELHEELVLEWESNERAVEATEGSDIMGYKFQGYNVYQLPSATSSKEDGILLATYDLETSPGYIFQQVFDPESGVSVNRPVQFGVNSGIERYYRVTTDLFTNQPLINGKTYYFAVTAYSQNMSTTVSTHALESPIAHSLKIGIPHAPNPQTIYPYSLGDTVVVKNKIGINDAPVIPVIVDPDAPAGETFEVRFSVSESGDKTWALVQTNVTPEDTLIAQSESLDGDSEYRFLGNGGFVLKVDDAPTGIKSVTDGGVNVVGEPYTAGGYYLTGSLHELEGKGVDESDYEIRFTPGVSWALTGAPLTETFWISVPFEMWDLGLPDDASDDVQIFSYVHDAADDGLWNTTGNDEVGGFAVFDRIHMAKVEYSDDTGQISTQDKAKIFFSEQFWPIDNISFVDITGTASAPATGTSITIRTFKAIKDGDVKAFSVGTVDRSDTGNTPKKRVQEVTVFPNLYLGMNTWESSPLEKFITFSHLPLRATIRIYSLSGVLVETIEKNDLSQFVRWDLTNSSDLPVASGIYIAHIEMPDLGEEVLLKLAIVQEGQYERKF